MAAPGVGSWLILAVNPVFLVPALSLVAALLVGAVVIALFRRWQQDTKLSPDAGEELSRYRTLYEQGAISEKEFHAVRAVLGGNLKRSMKMGSSHPEVPEPARPQGLQGPRETLPKTPPEPDLPEKPSEGIRPAE